jgi:Flp pilus assembly CpaF family ATPase
VTTNNHRAYRHPPDQAAAAQPVAVDFAVVKQLRGRVNDRMAQLLRTRDIAPANRQLEEERLAAEVVGGHVDDLIAAGTAVSPGLEAALLDAVAADPFGLGPLQKLLKNENVVGIHALGMHTRVVYADGSVRTGPALADSDEALVQMLQNLAMRAGATERSLSSARPWVDLQLPDGSRMTALVQVSSTPVVAIRRHTIMDVTLDELRHQYGLIDELICNLLKAAMRSGLNVMIAALAGAGKTTLMRGMAREIPEGEAFVTLEESRELGLETTGRHPWCISLEAREGHGGRGPDGRPAGEVSIADLIPLTLRMSVQRIIVGEVRSREVVAMLQAMATSRGSMCTIHARHPNAVMDRIVELALSHGREMTAELARRIAAGAIDLIVYISVDDESAIGGTTHRYVSHILEIGGMSGDRIVTTTLFGPGPDGRAVPRHLPDRLHDQLLRVGYDPRPLTAYIQQGEDNRGAWTTPLHTIIGGRR